MLTLGASIGHFPALVLFALFVSVALACVTRRTTRGRFKYALWSFVLFIAVGVAIAWLMYPFSR